MSVKKERTTIELPNGNTQINEVDGSSRIYIGGYREGQNYMEVTDDGDRAVDRRRYMPWQKSTPVADDLEIRTGAVVDFEDDAAPGVDDLDDD